MKYAEFQVLNYSDHKVKSIDVCRLAGIQLVRPQNRTVSSTPTQVAKYRPAGRQAGGQADRRAGGQAGKQASSC